MWPHVCVSGEDPDQACEGQTREVPSEMKVTVAPVALWRKKPVSTRSPERKLRDSEAVAGWRNLQEESQKAVCITWTPLALRPFSCGFAASVVRDVREKGNALFFVAALIWSGPAVYWISSITC